MGRSEVGKKDSPPAKRKRGDTFGAQHEWIMRRCSNSLDGDYDGDGGSNPPVP